MNDCGTSFSGPYTELRRLAERWLYLSGTHPIDVERAYRACALELHAVIAELERADACSKPLPELRPISTTLLRVGAEPQPTTPAENRAPTESQ